MLSSLIMPNPEFRTGIRYPDDVTATFIALANQRIAVSTRFTVALSGGSTPRALYQSLAVEPARSSIDWSRVEIFQGDERAVPPDHPDSNWRMAVESLLQHVPIKPENLHRMEAERPDLDAAAGEYETLLKTRLGPSPSIDLILLGLGEDGHTASLFPGTAALNETKRLVVANEVPQLNTRRMTLTYPALALAKEIWFLMTGEKKLMLVREITGQGTGTPCPAAKAQSMNGRTIWWLPD